MTERTKESCNTAMQKVLSDWNQDVLFRSSNREISTILDKWVSDKIWEDTTNTGFMPHDIVERFCPKPSEKDPSLMSIYENATKYMAEVRLIGKPGKLIKRIFPYMNPQEVETFVSWYKDTFVQGEMGYQVKSGKEAKDFKHAYSGTQSPENDCKYDHHNIKSLSGSCMRHSFDNLPCHPAEVYASGDFSIFWVEDSQERIVARCVVYHKTDTSFRAGPIYTNTNLATEMLTKHLESLGITDFGESFEGAKINKVEYRHNSFVIPFIDNCNYAEYYDDQYWILLDDKPNSEYLEGQTCGYSDLSSGGVYCEDCGDQYDEDSMTYLDHGCVCDICLSENYNRCEDDGCYYLNDETTEVYRYSGYGRTSDIYRTQWAENNTVYCENEDEFWRDTDVIFIESEEIYVPTKIAESEYFESTVDSIWYSNDQLVETELGNMTKEQAIEADMTSINGVYMRASEAYQTETVEIETANRDKHGDYIVETKTSLILRDNYELDDYLKPQRNPELPF